MYYGGQSQQLLQLVMEIYPITTDGRIIDSMLMITGITILRLFISTLSNSLIESGLSKRKNQNISKTKYDNYSNNNNTIKEETKLLINNKIDSLE
jgi:hypothetical protein